MKVKISDINYINNTDVFKIKKGEKYLYIKTEELEKNYYLVKNKNGFDLKKYFLPVFIHKLWMSLKNFIEKDHYLYSDRAVTQLKNNCSTNNFIKKIHSPFPSPSPSPTGLAERKTGSPKEIPRHVPPRNFKMLQQPLDVFVRQKLKKMSEEQKETVKSIFTSEEQLLRDLKQRKIIVLHLENSNIPAFLIKKRGEGCFGIVGDRLNLIDGTLDFIKIAKADVGLLAEKDIDNTVKKLEHIHSERRSPILGVQDVVHKVTCYTNRSETSGLLCTKCLSDLSSFIAKENYSNIEHASKLLMCHQLLSGLKFIHEKGIVHGDLKTENVLLKSIITDKEDSQIPIVQIADFGGAIDATDRKGPTISRRWMNKNDHRLLVHPLTEQNSRLEIGKKHDVFSMGIILYMILKGKRPFERDGSFPELSSYENIEPLNEDGSLTPLDQLIRSMLDSDREQRPSTEEVYSAFENSLDEQLLEKIKQQEAIIETS